jgi:hypothetical protein
METVTSDPWLDMTTVAHGYFHRQDFHLLDKQLGSLHYPSIVAVPVGCRLRKEWATRGLMHCSAEKKARPASQSKQNGVLVLLRARAYTVSASRTCPATSAATSAG